MNERASSTETHASAPSRGHEAENARRAPELPAKTMTPTKSGSAFMYQAAPGGKTPPKQPATKPPTAIAGASADQRAGSTRCCATSIGTKPIHTRNHARCGANAKVSITALAAASAHPSATRRTVMISPCAFVPRRGAPGGPDRARAPSP